MVTIAEEMPRHLVPGEGIAKLLRGPRGLGMLRDGDRNDAPAIMASRTKTNRSRHVAVVGTTKKSAAISCGAWAIAPKATDRWL